MDADYYYSVGLQIINGFGLNELVLWNYLDDPAGLPHPSNAYWMPLPSFVAWMGMAVTGSTKFSYSRSGFILVASLIPPLTSFLAHHLTSNRNSAILAGMIAVVPGFYLPYLATTDAFGLYMVFGICFLLLISESRTKAERFPIRLRFFLLGMVSGLMHLSRADGFIWLGVSLGAIILPDILSKHHLQVRNLLTNICLCTIGYFTVMGPWLYRNLSVFGALLSPGGERILWLTDYDELFIYPGSLLTFDRWVHSGLENILRDRIWALGQNLQTVLAIQGSVFLFPLTVIGAIRLRQCKAVQFGIVGWLITLFIMTIFFPYAGSRGGMFHSGASLQPLWWALAPVGLESIINWGTQIRSWNAVQARNFLSSGIFGFLLIMTLFVSHKRIIGENFNTPSWNDSYRRFIQVEIMLGEAGARPGEIVMINNAPGYFLVTGRPAISIPYGDKQTLLEAARHYQARYLILEFEQLSGDDNLYTKPKDYQELHYLGTMKDIRVYEIVER